jgi:hypothetical protein
LWARRGDVAADEGIGMAIGWWPGGYEPAAAVCRLDSDGRLTVITGAADMTGVETPPLDHPAASWDDPSGNDRGQRASLERAGTSGGAGARARPRARRG